MVRVFKRFSLPDLSLLLLWDSTAILHFVVRKHSVIRCRDRASDCGWSESHE